MRILITATAVVFIAIPLALAQPALTPQEQLGKSIFFDTRLSLNSNQACAACHAPEVGGTGPSEVLNTAGSVYEGSIAGAFGNRKPPASSYMTQSPILHYEMEKGEALFIGGSFWDGRATGERLGSPAAEQALGPFLNPLEQALPSAAAVVALVCDGPYGDEFRDVWGDHICDAGAESEAYDAIGLSIAAYEGSPESDSFTSKYDYYLKGMANLTREERNGLALFRGKGKCDNCHTLGSNNPRHNGEPALFTDFTFDNLGLPRNPQNPFYVNAAFNPLGFDWVDSGLGGFLASRVDYAEFAEENMGKHKVPTLRNVDKRPYESFVKAFGHNGYFKSLKSIVHFYNTRDVNPVCADRFTTEAEALAQGCWPEPEIAENINTTELGNLHLTPAQEDAIVTFLKTLSDGYEP